jgi:phosphoglycolate phosphatase-like HAD superfamily hydrolase
MTKRAYIFDIDGTLSDPKHRLHHIDSTRTAKADWPAFFAACGQDAPIPHMIELLKGLWDSGAAVLFCTGRSDDVSGNTVDWLGAHLLRPGERFDAGDVYMRKAGDHRADTIVKSELMDRIIADGWTPIMVFEDRASVVTMWRERGIPCLPGCPW